MSSLKEKAKFLPQITIDGENQPEIVLNITFGGIEIKKVIICLTKFEFNADDPGNEPIINLRFKDVE